jgi:hypothetical protein
MSEYVELPAHIMPEQGWLHEAVEPLVEFKNWLVENIPHAEIETIDIAHGNGVGVKLVATNFVTGIDDNERMLIKLMWGF